MENVDSIINSALENTHTILNFEVTSLQPLEDADTSFTIYSNPIDDIQQKAAEEHHNDISEQENNTGKAVSSISGGDIECPVYIESVTAEPSIEAGNHIEDSSSNYRGQAQIQLSVRLHPGLVLSRLELTTLPVFSPEGRQRGAAFRHGIPHKKLFCCK